MAAKSPSDPPVLFISYAHEDAHFKDELLTHLEPLLREDRLTTWDDQNLQGGDPWYDDIHTAMDAARLAVLLISADFLASDFIMKTEVPRLLERWQEDGVRLFPIIIRPCIWGNVSWLSQFQVRPAGAKPLSTCRKPEREEKLADIAREISLLLNARRSSVTALGAAITPEQINIARMPRTGGDFEDREFTFELLDGAWQDRNTNIVSIVAFGGVGKSALVNEWMSRMQPDAWRGAQRVFAWSFYREGRAASADEFIQKALGWFGDRDPTSGDLWDKGERLADFMRQERTLMVLDGLEPLQERPQHVRPGSLVDYSLRAFLGNLAGGHLGLCIITTRRAVYDLAQWRHGSAITIDLEYLPTNAGIKLLERLGVRGTTDVLRQVVNHLRGHALSLRLVARYLVRAYHGDANHFQELQLPVQNEDDTVDNIMEAYEGLLDSPHLSLMHVVGLFDRPACDSDLRALLKDPIRDLTTQIPHEDLDGIVHDLRDCDLLLPPDAQDPTCLDAHPLVREYFGRRLKERFPAAWIAGHKCLYWHIKCTTAEKPKTREEMMPLFSAVTHGCLAHEFSDVFREVLRERILQEGFRWTSTNTLGLWGSTLGAFSHFFDKPWTTLRSEIRDFPVEDQADLFTSAGLCLRTQCRFHESTQATTQGHDILRRRWEELQNQEDPQEKEVASALSKAARNLSQTHVAVGSLTDAAKFGKISAETAAGTKEELTCLARYGEVLHHMGNLREGQIAVDRFSDAKSIFQQAEELHRKKTGDPDAMLDRFAGYEFCDLLVSCAAHDPRPPQEALDRLEKRACCIIPKEKSNRLHDGLKSLMLARISLLRSRGSSQPELHLDEAWEHACAALKDMQKHGERQHVPLGLLAKAEVACRLGNFDESEAQATLEEARQIAEPRKDDPDAMGLHLTDYFLIKTLFHLCRDLPEDKKAANIAFGSAKKLIEETGYHRRDTFLSQLANRMSSQ